MNINIVACNNCPSGYTISDIEEIQKGLDAKIASVINKEYSSKRNDLGYYLDEEGFRNLVWLQEILENVKYCNSCYGDYDIEDIINVVKTNKNKLK